MNAQSPRKALLSLACALLLAGVSIAQTAAPAKQWSFDVISVKQNKSGTDMMRVMMNKGSFHAQNLGLHELVSIGFDVRPDLISGFPSWTDGPHYDVDAKMTPEDAEAFDKLSHEEQRAINRKLMEGVLAQRFGIRTHTEVKQLPVYDLVIAKGGLKMKQAKDGDDYPNGIKGPDGKSHGGMMRMGPGLIDVQGGGIEGFTRSLTDVLHRPVIDKTGLKGKYDFTLKYTPDRDAPGPDAGVTGDDTPSIFAAIEEQLGLKLVPNKGPVDTLVIDHIEQPSEN